MNWIEVCFIQSGQAEHGQNRPAEVKRLKINAEDGRYP
jgi:hypothetical protein